MKSNPYVKEIQSRIHNRGLHAKCDIPAETRIIEYIGERITEKEADDRVEADSGHCVYLFELEDDTVIDGDTDDNLAKCINHSCDPNCYSEIEDEQIWIMSLRDIKKGEELTYDYGFQRPGWEDHPCLCGTKDCFGFIVARPHRKAIAKTKRYQKLIT